MKGLIVVLFLFAQVAVFGVEEFALSFGDATGSPLTLSAGLGLGYFWSHHTGDTRLLAATEDGWDALFRTNVYIHALKLATHRSRPYVSTPSVWRGPSLSLNNDYLSFPSSHTGSAFAMATVVAHHWNDVPLVGWGAYSLAVLVGWSRVRSQAHWLEDVCLGALIGLWVGHDVVQDSGEEKLGFNPHIGGDRLGLVYRF